VGQSAALEWQNQDWTRPQFRKSFQEIALTKDRSLVAQADNEQERYKEHQGGGEPSKTRLTARRATEPTQISTSHHVAKYFKWGMGMQRIFHELKGVYPKQTTNEPSGSRTAALTLFLFLQKQSTSHVSTELAAIFSRKAILELLIVFNFWTTSWT
jgi:hypothetical protein